MKTRPILTPDQREAYAEALSKGQKIPVIKHLRANTGLGLAEAKSFIDQLEKEMVAENPERFRKVEQNRKAGCVSILFLFLLVVIILINTFQK